MTTATRSPADLSRDLLRRMAHVNRAVHANSGQIAVLNTLAFLQMGRAVSGIADVGVHADSIRLATGLSKSTVNRHLKFWTDYGVLVREETYVRPTWRMVLPE